MSWLIENAWLILFLLWGLPMGMFRSRFRKLVYQTNDWKINIKPLFTRELKALFGNVYPDNESYRKLRNKYRYYLIIYVLLFVLYKADLAIIGNV